MAAPRGAPPVPHQARAPYLSLTPSVPEPSMFFPSSQGFSTPARPGSANSSLGPPCPRPPVPTAAPSQHLLRPQSEFSRVFHQTEATVFLQGSDTAHFELLERHVQFNTTDMRERVNVDQSNLNTRWMGNQEAPQSLPTDKNGGWESAPVRLGDQRHPAQHQEEMATPRLRALPQTSASVPAPRIAPVTDLEARSPEVIPSRGCIVRPPESSSQAGGGPLGVEGSPSIPPELMNLLSWQNDQLRRLQDQVQQLLAASPQNQGGQKESSAALVDSKSTSSSPTLRRGDRGSHLVSSSSMPNMPPSTASVATNTSSLWPDIQKGLARLREVEEEEVEEDLVIGKSEVRGPREESISQPSIHLDLPEYQESPSGDRRPANMTSWSSPVLGESVSMYEEMGRHSAEPHVAEDQEDVAELYHNILGQVKRLLAKEEDTASPPPPPPLSLPSATSSRASGEVSSKSSGEVSSSKTKAPPLETSAPTLPNPRVATLARLKEMGVSFINPSPDQNSEQSVFLPKAQLPSQSVFQGASTDSSLDISSLALKYLDDDQLNNLALKHQGEQKKQVRWGEQGQTSGTELSMASHQFLARHGLAGDRENTGTPVNMLGAPVNPANREVNQNHHNPGGKAHLGAETRLQVPNEDNRLLPRAPLPLVEHQRPHHNNLAHYQPADQAPSQRIFPLPVANKENIPVLHPGPGPHPQMAPGPMIPGCDQLRPGPHVQMGPGPHDQLRPGPHVQMGAPATLVDRVLDITAIQQQPKLL